MVQIRFSSSDAYALDALDALEGVVMGKGEWLSLLAWVVEALRGIPFLATLLIHIFSFSDFRI